MLPKIPLAATLTIVLFAAGLVPGVPGVSADASDGLAWPSSEVGLSAYETIANDNISIQGDFMYLRNLQFPAGNDFFEYTGGGYTYAFHYDNATRGLFHGGIDIAEPYAALSPEQTASRALTSDGRVSVVTAATVAADDAPAVIVSHWFHNLGDSPLDLRVYDFAEANANGADTETTSYDATSQVLSSTNLNGARAILGVASCTPAFGHAIGTVDIFDQLGAGPGGMSNDTTYTGDSWFAHGVDGGTLAPNATVQVDFVLLAAPEGGSVADAGDHCPAAGAPPVDFIVPPPPPTNDDLAAALAYPALPATATQTTNGATVESNEPLPCGAIGSTVWYTLTPDVNATIVLDTLGSHYDTVLAAYTGTGYGDLQLVACNDDTDGLLSEIRFQATAGQTYLIQVGGFAGDEGYVELNGHAVLPPPPPANDAFADAIIASSAPASFSQTTEGATLESGEPTACNLGASVWYALAFNETSTVSIDTFSSGFDTVLAVYTGTGLGDLQLVDCNDDSHPRFQSRVGFEADAGTTYWVQVGGYGGDTGALELTIASFANAENDDRADALVIDRPFTHEASTVVATLEAGEVQPSCAPIGNTVWYRYTAPVTPIQLAVDTAGSDFDTVVAVYTDVLGSDVEIGCRDDNGDSEQARVQFFTVPGRTYWIQVGGYGGDAGNLQLRTS